MVRGEMTGMYSKLQCCRRACASIVRLCASTTQALNQNTEKNTQTHLDAWALPISIAVPVGSCTARVTYVHTTQHVQTRTMLKSKQGHTNVSLRADVKLACCA